ncbi:MAG: hypothetical protein ACIAQU_05830 [Phycisphaerales bacterium JB064]
MRPKPQSILDDLRDERLVVGLITALLVTAAALVQAGFLGPLSTANPALHLLQGPVVAIYGLVLSVCIDPKRGLVPGTLFVVAGASQPGWLLGTLMGLSALGLHRSTIPDPLWQALPFALTGLVFTPIAWLAVRAWWGLAFMLLTTAAAAYVTGWSGGAVWGVPAEAVAVTLLHLGLCWTLTGAVVARTWRIVPHENEHCPACGYPREGLRANICPECGGRLP